MESKRARAGAWKPGVRVRVCGAQYHKYLRVDSLRSSKSLFNKCGFPLRRKKPVSLHPVSDQKFFKVEGGEGEVFSVGMQQRFAPKVPSHELKMG